MNQLFYNIAGGIVRQIRRKKRTTISEVIDCGERNIRQNRNWFYFRFSAESSSFIFKTEKFKLIFEGWKRPVCHLFGFTRVSFCQNLLHFTRTVKRIVTALMRSFLSRCFSLFLPHLRALALWEKVGKLSSFWDWWAGSLFLSIIVAKYNIFPRANNAISAADIAFIMSSSQAIVNC